MKNKLFTFILITLVGLGSFSCVSKKKYTELENLKNQIQAMLDDNKAGLSDEEQKTRDLEVQLKDCGEEKSQLATEKAMKIQQVEQLTAQLDEVQVSFNDLNSRYKQLKSQSSQKIQDLIDDLEQLQTDLTQREKRLKELQTELDRRDSTLKALQGSLQEALLGFNQDGMTVEMKNGKVYVTLTNKLLFASGSTKIDEKGKQALREVAKVLTEQPNITIMVEGHTDNVPVSNLGDIKDNWDLSVMRSTAVVRLLVESGIEQTRIIPSGRGQWTPKVEGDSPEARAQNRRTELILSPKWDLLYELVKPKE